MGELNSSGWRKEAAASCTLGTLLSRCGRSYLSPVRPGGRGVGDSWHGLMAPKGTPADAVTKINALAQKIIASDDFQQRLHDYGPVPAGGTPADFQKFLVEDGKTWAKVVRGNAIKVE